MAVVRDFQSVASRRSAGRGHHNSVEDETYPLDVADVHPHGLVGHHYYDRELPENIDSNPRLGFCPTPMRLRRKLPRAQFLPQKLRILNG